MEKTSVIRPDLTSPGISYIVPMYDVLEQRYQRQMAELERQQVQQKLAAQVAEAPCSPL